MTTTRADLEAALQAVAGRLLNQDGRPPVNEPADINNGFCTHAAELAYKRLGAPDDVRILHTGGMNALHTWLECNGRHYDAERPGGVPSHADLPFFQRHEHAAGGNLHDLTGEWQTVSPPQDD